MASKRFWLGIPVLVLVFGMAVVGCGSMVTNSGPDPRLTDGKGGKIVISYIDTEYWVKDPLPNQSVVPSGLNNRAASLYPRSYARTVHEDGEYEILYRRKRSEDEYLDVNKEDKSLWSRKTVYVSGDQTVEVTIP